MWSSSLGPRSLSWDDDDDDDDAVCVCVCVFMDVFLPGSSPIYYD